MWRSLYGLSIWALVACGLSGCSARPNSSVLTPVLSPPGYTSKVDMLVATTRGLGTPHDAQEFTSERATLLNYSALTISIPRTHVAGQSNGQTPVRPISRKTSRPRIEKY